MKFFKHFTDSHRGNSMQEILNTFGHKGHSVWWILVEICAEKLDKGADERFTENHCKFVFDARYLRDNLRLSDANVTRMLHQFATMALLRCSKVNNKWHLEFPKLLESLDRDTKRARQVRAIAAPKKKNKEEEEEKELRDEHAARQTAPPLVTFWNEILGQKLSSVRPPSKARIKKIQTRYQEHSPEVWREALLKIAASDFCCGKNDRGWKATFDWILQTETVEKILEGKYDNKSKGFMPTLVVDEEDHFG